METVLSAREIALWLCSRAFCSPLPIHTTSVSLFLLFCIGRLKERQIENEAISRKNGDKNEEKKGETKRAESVRRVCEERARERERSVVLVLFLHGQAVCPLVDRA